jgi:hypothetical protein
MQPIADGLFWNRGSVVERLKSISGQAGYGCVSRKYPYPFIVVAVAANRFHSIAIAIMMRLDLGVRQTIFASPAKVISQNRHL